LYFQSHFQISLPDYISIGRVSGETAPILFTVAAYFLPKLPTSIFDQAMALPYHLYVISTSGTDIENQERWLMVQHLY
jgi:ABC-type phosphate transport system permease subunit